MGAPSLGNPSCSKLYFSPLSRHCCRRRRRPPPAVATCHPLKLLERRHHGEIHPLPSTSSLAVHADHTSFRYIAMSGLPIYHQLLPVPSRSMQAASRCILAPGRLHQRKQAARSSVHPLPMLDLHCRESTSHRASYEGTCPTYLICSL